ncbi:MAG: hypothetical protein JWM23_1223 [Microbacteriaceae bacterium]|nr:hypothetical protein [Microbacteriaceae bacterium]
MTDHRIRLTLLSPRTLGFAGTCGARASPEDEQVLVLDQPLRVTGSDGLAHVLLLEERRPRYEDAVADSGDERDEFLDQRQPGGDTGRRDHAGDVDEFTACRYGRAVTAT